MSKFDFEYVIDSHPTGSSYICDPPVNNTDVDTIILSRAGYEKSLGELGFKWTDTDHEYESMGAFVSWRRGNENYIVTEDPIFYIKFVKATRKAKELNLLDKVDRISLFQKVLYQ